MDRELQYVLFMAERSIEDARNMAYIQECLVLAEGTNVVERIAVINEGVVDKAKAAWAKVKEWVKNVWAKFTEKLNKLALDDAKYLKEYQDIIFNRKPIDATYSMLNYPLGIERCTKIKVPKLNYASMKDQLDKNDPGKFLKYVISEYDDKTPVKDFISRYFKGGTDEPQNIHVSKLKFADMYDFCLDYKKIHTTVENDRKAIEDSFTEAENAINALNVAPKAESFFGPEDMAYSNVYRKYITEEDATPTRTVTNNDANKTSNPTPQAAAGQKASDNVGNQNIDDKKTPEDRAKETQDAVDKKEDGNANVEEATDKIKVYLDVATAIMSAKMSAIEGAHKAYMKILRTHIQDHVGNKDSERGSNSQRTNYEASAYDKSSQARKDEIDNWAKTNLDMSINDIQSRIDNKQGFSGDAIAKFDQYKSTLIGYIGQARYNDIRRASDRAK